MAGQIDRGGVLGVHQEVIPFGADVLQGDVAARPQRLGGIRHRNVREVDPPRAAEGLGRLNHRVGKRDVFGVPDARAGGVGEDAVAERDVASVPERILPAEGTAPEREPGALFERRLAVLEDTVGQGQVTRAEERPLPRKNLSFKRFHISAPEFCLSLLYHRARKIAMCTFLISCYAREAGTAASAHAGAEEKRGGTNGEGKQDTRERKTK